MKPPSSATMTNAAPPLKSARSSLSTTLLNRIIVGSSGSPSMLGFKSVMAAQDTLVGIELMHMLKKRQLVGEEGEEHLTAAERFYSLAA